MTIDWNWILLLGGAFLILIEVALGGFAGFDLVLIGSATMLGGALGMLFGRPEIGFIVASSLSLLYVGVGRRWVRARLANRPTRTNVDALVGQKGMVTLRIETHAPGQVRVNDETWRAVPATGAGPFEPGAVITVSGVDGVTLQVR